MDTIVITAVFLDPLKSDDAVANLKEAGFAPVQQIKNQQATITLKVKRLQLGNARQILVGAGATTVSETND